MRRNAVRDGSESLSAINRNPCPQSPESAVKSRCAREWDGWGRLSDDGPGQNNPDPSEGPWGGGDPT